MQDKFDRADFSELETIHVQSCWIGDKFLQKLSLQHIDNVQLINIKDNDIKSKGLKHLMSKDYLNLQKL